MCSNTYSNLLSDECKTLNSSQTFSEWLFWQNSSLVTEVYGTDAGAAVYIEKLIETENVPAIILEELAYHPSPDVRIAVADSENTPIDILWSLTMDENADVRFAMAENHNLKREMLQFLMTDKNPFVADRAQRTIYRLNLNESANNNIAKFPATKAYLVSEVEAAAC